MTKLFYQFLFMTEGNTDENIIIAILIMILSLVGMFQAFYLAPTLSFTGFMIMFTVSIIFFYGAIKIIENEKRIVYQD